MPRNNKRRRNNRNYSKNQSKKVDVIQAKESERNPTNSDSDGGRIECDQPINELRIEHESESNTSSQRNVIETSIECQCNDDSCDSLIIIVDTLTDHGILDENKNDTIIGRQLDNNIDIEIEQMSNEPTENLTQIQNCNEFHNNNSLHNDGDRNNDPNDGMATIQENVRNSEIPIALIVHSFTYDVNTQEAPSQIHTLMIQQHENVITQYDDHQLSDNDISKENAQQILSENEVVVISSDNSTLIVNTDSTALAVNMEIVGNEQSDGISFPVTTTQLDRESSDNNFCPIISFNSENNSRLIETKSIVIITNEIDPISTDITDGIKQESSAIISNEIDQISTDNTEGINHETIAIISNEIDFLLTDNTDGINYEFTAIASKENDPLLTDITDGIKDETIAIISNEIGAFPTDNTYGLNHESIAIILKETDPTSTDITNGIKDETIATISNKIDLILTENTDRIKHESSPIISNEIEAIPTDNTDGINYESIAIISNKIDPLSTDITDGIKDETIAAISNKIDPLSTNITNGIKHETIEIISNEIEPIPTDNTDGINDESITIISNEIEHISIDNTNETQPDAIAQSDLKITKESEHTEDTKKTDNDNAALNRAIQTITKQYRVDSPPTTSLTIDGRKSPNIAIVRKSRSLDDNDVMIQEIVNVDPSEIVAEENESNPIVSEAESEMSESEDHNQTMEKSSHNEIVTRIAEITTSDVEESCEHILLCANGSEVITENSEIFDNYLLNQSLVEIHSPPKYLHSKYLDVISEESSDYSDSEQSNAKLQTPSPFGDTKLIIAKKANAIYPRSSLDFSIIKKHMPKESLKDVIREEPPCLLVDIKIIEPDFVQEGCSKWVTTELASAERCAEIVYIHSSSSSASSVNGDSIGDADGEDDDSYDDDPRIDTPVIGSIFENIFSDMLLSYSDSNKTVCDELSSDEHVVDSNANDVRIECDQSDLYANVVNTEFDVNSPSPRNNNCSPLCFNESLTCKSNELTNIEFIRQDSSGSVSSSHSRSTSHSQCTAKYYALSPPRDIADFDNGLTYVSGSSSGTSTTGQLKSLRQQCLDVLSSMPYGNVVLEELANVAESLRSLTDKHQKQSVLKRDHFNMPYPQPDLPYIDDLEVPRYDVNRVPTTVALMSIPPLPQPPPRSDVPKIQPRRLKTSIESVAPIPIPPPRSDVPPKPQPRHSTGTSLPDLPPSPPPPPRPELPLFHPTTSPEPNHLPQIPPLPLPPPPPPPPPPPIPIDQPIPKPRTNTLNEMKRLPSPPPPPRPEPPATNRLNNHDNFILTDSSPSPPPRPEPPKLQSWLGLPTESDPNVLLCLSPSQRHYINDNQHIIAETNPDLLLEMHHKFVERRGYHELSDAQVEALSREKDTSCTSVNQSGSLPESVQDGAKDKNRLLAIIRDSKQSANSEHIQVRRDGPISEFESSGGIIQNPITNDKSMSHGGRNTDDYYNKRHSNIDRFIAENTPTLAASGMPQKRYSHIEKSSLETKKRIENGNVVFEYSDSSNEKSTNINDDSSGVDAKNSPSGQDIKSNFSADSNLKNSNRTFDIPVVKTEEKLSSSLKKESKIYEIPIRRTNESSTQRTKEANVTFDIPSTKPSEQSAASPTARVHEIPIIKTNEISGQASKDTNRIFEIPINKPADPKTSTPGTSGRVYEIPIRKTDENFKSQKASFESKFTEKTSTNQTSPTDQPNGITFKEFDYMPKFFDDFWKDSDKMRTLSSPHHESHFSEKTIQNETFRENRYRSSPNMLNKSHEKSQSTQNLDNVSETITKPITREENLCRGMGSNTQVRAPRIQNNISPLFSESTESFEELRRHYDWSSNRPRISQPNRQSMIEQTPMTNRSQGTSFQQRRQSLPKEIHDKQMDYIRQKEMEIHDEFDKLERERQHLLKEIEEMRVNQTFKDIFTANKNRSNGTLQKHQSEADLFRQQMHNEWLDKVAEREERRLHKIIKITKKTDEQITTENELQRKPLNVGDEFLNRVKERRTKLQMPSDSDWESGAESHPPPRSNPTEQKMDPDVKILEGQKEADVQKLPRHLKEFASEFTTKTITSENNEPPKVVHESKETQHHREITTNGDGIWSPSNTPQPTRRAQQESQPPTTEQKRPHSSQQQQFPVTAPTPPPPPSFWTPKSTEPSPVFERREFRPVKFESPVLQRRIFTRQHSDVTPPWSNSAEDKSHNSNLQQTISRSYSSLTSTTKPQSVKPSNPSITLLQKAKEVQLPQNNIFAENERPKIPHVHLPGTIKPNEIVHPVKHEYLNEQENYPRKMEQFEPKKSHGIGPTTRDGMPIILRSEVDENNHHKWYKKMYNTLHKVHQDDDYVTVRYKTRRGRYPYKSNGYMSEPEHNYDSDYSVKYNTLDRRRVQPPVSTDNKYYGTLPNPIKCSSGIYKNQPGKIENYVPGYSSISEKERKENFEHEKLRNRSYAEGYLSRALKDQGYESDSTLVFRKKDNQILPPLSPDQQKQAYVHLQAGGEVPLQGFRKTAPEKPKESPRRYVETDVNIHYKTPVRFEYKDPVPEAELAYRQAEHMKKLYQEERRRKYLQELQDMSNRRHTDYFTPSQKSPIALNRYDDFSTDLSPVSPPSVRTVARALYNFQGQSARELSFRKGDIIYIRREIDKNWYEGEHNAMVGLLPSNYVEIISTRDGNKPTPKKLAEGQARAKFNFHAQSAIELSLNKGELVTLTRRVDDNWFEGRIANRKGIFPVTYVEVLTDIGSEIHTSNLKPVGSPAAHSLTITPVSDYQTSRTNYNSDAYNTLSNSHPQNGIVRANQTIQKTEVLHVDTNSEPVAYRAIYKYRPQNSDELELQEGDTVYVLEKCDDGWFVGTSQRTGCFGTFPGNYVEKL